MPELPEVETVRRGLAVPLEGRRVTKGGPRRGGLRRRLPANFAARATGRRIQRIDRRAKYLLFALDGGETLIGHLGMSGRLYLAPPGSAEAAGRHDHLRFHTEDGWLVTFQDARRFGMMDLWPSDRLGE